MLGMLGRLGRLGMLGGLGILGGQGPAGVSYYWKGLFKNNFVFICVNSWFCFIC